VEQQSFATGCKLTHMSPNAPLPNSAFVPSITSCIHITVPRYLQLSNVFSSLIFVSSMYEQWCDDWCYCDGNPYAKP